MFDNSWLIGFECVRCLLAFEVPLVMSHSWGQNTATAESAKDKLSARSTVELQEQRLC